MTEVASALGGHTRRRTLTESQALAAWAQFRRHVLGSFSVLTPKCWYFDLAHASCSASTLAGAPAMPCTSPPPSGRVLTFSSCSTDRWRESLGLPAKCLLEPSGSAASGRQVEPEQDTGRDPEADCAAERALSEPLLPCAPSISST